MSLSFQSSPISLVLLILTLLLLPVPADGQNWQERPAPESNLGAEEKNQLTGGALSAAFVAIIFGVLIYLFTQDGTLTAGIAFFIFLGTTTSLVLGILIGVGAVWWAFATRE